jgi:phosphohistidine phosphatase
MKIYLLRHGDSAPFGVDNERPLSERGIEEINRLAEFIAKRNIHVSAIFHSEKSRARETAAIIATAISSETEPETLAELDPLSPVQPVIKMINSLKGEALFVGHMPFMGVLVSELTTRTQNQDIALFKTGTMVCLEKVDSSRWVIRWMLNPGLFE